MIPVSEDTGAEDEVNALAPKVLKSGYIGTNGSSKKSLRRYCQHLKRLL